MLYYTHEDIGLEGIEEHHLDILRKHRNEQDTWTNLTDVNFIHNDQQLAWYKKLSTDSTKKYFIASNGKDPIGMVRIDEIDYINRSARVGCDIFKNYRNKGLGTKVMGLISHYCIDVINLHRLYLSVAEYNKSAIRVYSKAGFTEEGRQKDALYRDGKYNDYIMMSLIKGEGNE